MLIYRVFSSDFKYALRMNFAKVENAINNLRNNDGFQNLQVRQGRQWSMIWQYLDIEILEHISEKKLFLKELSIFYEITIKR